MLQLSKQLENTCWEVCAVSQRQNVRKNENKKGERKPVFQLF